MVVKSFSATSHSQLDDLVNDFIIQKKIEFKDKFDVDKFEHTVSYLVVPASTWEEREDRIVRKVFHGTSYVALIQY